MDGADGWFGSGREGCADGRRVADVSDRQVQQHPDVAVIQPVEHMPARTAGRHDAMRPHQPKCLARGGFTQPAHRGQVMDTDLPCFKQSGQDPDTARVGHQPKHIGQTLHVGRGRQGTPEEIDPFLFTGQPVSGRPVRVWKRPNLCAHVNILVSDQIIGHGTADRPGGPGIPRNSARPAGRRGPASSAQTSRPGRGTSRQPSRCTFRMRAEIVGLSAAQITSTGGTRRSGMVEGRIGRGSQICADPRA